MSTDTREALAALPPLPKKRRAMFCTKCGFSGLTEAEASPRGAPCQKCAYIAFVEEVEYSDEEMRAYARAALVAQPAQPSAQGEAVVWLVEWKADGYGPQWWGFDHTPGKNGTWCSDANNAIRFARKEDAERMRLHIIAVAGLTGMHEYERSVSVTEHMWPEAALASAPAAPAQPSAQYEEVGFFIRYSGRYATGDFVGEIQTKYGLNEGDKLYRVIK